MKAIYFFLFLIFIANTQAQITCTWVGGSSGDWHNSNNWDSHPNLPSSLDSVSIPNADVFLTGTQIAQARNLYIGASSSLEVNNGNRLELFSNNEQGIDLDGTLDVTGDVEVFDASLAINIAATGILLIKAEGKLFIKPKASISKDGILSLGHIENEGLISIEELTGYGIASYFTLDNDGQILIKELTGNSIEALRNDGALDNLGTIQIDNVIKGKAIVVGGTMSTFNNGIIGNIHVLNVSGEGIYIENSTVQFDNYGMIEVEKCAGADTKVIHNKGTLRNYTDSQILINELTGNSSYALYNSGQMVNDGDVIIEDVAFGIGNTLSTTEYINNKLTSITNASKQGFQNISGASLENHDEFTINIVSDKGIRNDFGSEILNEGVMSISNVTGNNVTAIENEMNSTFHNKDDLIISNIDGTSNIGILNDASTFTNMGTNSDLSINRVIDGKGIVNQNAGDIQNEGDVLVTLDGKDMITGIENTTSAVFNNYSTLEINQIESSGDLDFGIDNWKNSSFLNEGEVKINEARDASIRNEGTITNDGAITLLDNVDGEGLYNDALGNYFSLFNSNLYIRNLSGANANAIENLGTMTIHNASLTDITDAPAIYNHGNASDFKIEGDASILRIQDHGVLNDNNSIFEIATSGRLFIRDITGAFHDGIHNSSIFKNFGLVDIDRITNSFSKGISNDRIFENHQKINIDTVGLGVSNSSANANFSIGSNGVLNITQSTLFGIANASDATFVNGGDVTLHEIDQTSIDNNNRAYFENSGNITISNSIGALSHGINNRALATFLNGHVIQILDINGANSHGLFNTSFFLNNGDISIEDVEDGKGILVEGELQNLAGANISTTNIALEPLEVILGAILDCELGGTMDIQN